MKTFDIEAAYIGSVVARNAPIGHCLSVHLRMDDRQTKEAVKALLGSMVDAHAFISAEFPELCGAEA